MFRKSNLKIKRNGLTKIKVGGTEQVILTRCVSEENPILLFLHGGPGLSHIPLANKYQAPLEEDYTVINWDQRGTGLSYSNSISESSMTADQFLQDALEVIQQILKDFGQTKLYLTGHSWGSFLGVCLTHMHPEKIHTYIGISQVVDVNEASRMTYNHVLSAAEKENNLSAINELKDIEHPYYENETSFQIVRKWVEHYRADTGIDFTKVLLSSILGGSIYRPWHVVKFVKGLNFSQRLIREDAYKSLYDISTAYKVPLYFVMGEHDVTTPHELVGSFAEQISAPVKKIYKINGAGHCPHLQCYEEFGRIMSVIKSEVSKMSQ
jgi:pimeloyl-ACP methyl ester carboxylesterase